MPMILGGLLVAHGLITTMIGVAALTNPIAPALALPGWFIGWPGPFGRSWLFESLNLGSGISVVGGLLWVGAGVALIAGGLGWLGIGGVREVWQTIAFIGGAVGLLALGLYFHPLYLIGLVIDIAVVALLWGRVTTAS
jgi:hypothetical protein